MSWITARASLWHIELLILVEDLPPEWSLTDENIARLVDRDDFYLNSEWSRWTADPDDPDAKAEQDRRKALGIKPPPAPILRPVAARPLALQEVLVEQTRRRIERAEEPPRKKISLRELRELRASVQ